MTEKQKDKIQNLAASLIVSTIIFFVGFSFTNKREDNKELVNELRGKLDIIRYERDCEIKELRIKGIEQEQAKINQINAELTTHILYIRESIDEIKRKI